MNIYLVTQDKNNDYDTYDSFVCYAETEDEARVMAPSEYYIWKNDTWNFVYLDGSYKPSRFDSWCYPKYVEVTLVGSTNEDVESGVILASFNAG